MGLIPSCAPSSSISRTRETRIASLIRVCARRRAGLVERPASRSQRAFTKLASPPLSGRKRKAAASSGRFLVCSTRLNLRGALGSGGEERVRSCLQSSQVSKLLARSSPSDQRRLLAAALADRERSRPTPCRRRRHVRDLLELGVADPLADRLVGFVDLDAVAGIASLAASVVARPRGVLRRPGSPGPAPARARTGTRRRSARSGCR